MAKTPAIIGQPGFSKLLKWGEFCSHPHFQQHQLGRLVIGFP